MGEGYNIRLILLLIFFLAMWLIALFSGVRLYYPAFLLGIAMFMAGFLFSILLSKGEFDRRNQAGLQVFDSYWHSVRWKVARVLNGLLIFFGGVIAVLTYAVGILQATI